MSRFKDWNNAVSGIGNFLETQGLTLDIRNTKGKKDMFFGVEIQKIVHKYCNKHKIKGSFSDRVLIIQKDFKTFRDYVIANKETIYSKYL